MLHLCACFFSVQDIAAKLHQIAQPTRGSVHVSAGNHSGLSTCLYTEAPSCNGCHWRSRVRRLWVLFWHDDSVWVLHVLTVSVVLAGVSSRLTQSCQLATLDVNVSVTTSTCFTSICFYVVDGPLTLAPTHVIMHFIFF